MRFLVMSDNHGRWQKVQEVIDAFKDDVDHIFHCGDSEFPSDDPIWEAVTLVVSGNMDYDPQYRKVAHTMTDEGKVLVLHGHRHGVNFSNQQVLDLANEIGAKFVFHGHTHRLYAEVKDDVLLLNPGSLNQSRGPVPEKTFAVVSLSPEEILVEFYDDNLTKLTRLSQSFTR